jgi:hypothetical protein
MHERPPLHPELVTTFFDGQYRGTPERQALHNDLADQLTNHGSSAFLGETHAHYVHVPLATASEQHTEQTLHALAEQQQGTPLSTAAVVSLNRPSRLRLQDHGQVRQNRSLVEQFARQNPDIALSYFYITYNTGVPISDVRNDSYGAVMAGLYDQYGPNQIPDVLMTNWDADTSGASRGYLAETQHRYSRQDALVYRSFPMLEHDRLDSDHFPYTNHLLAWYDLVQRAGRSAAPAHCTVNLGAIAASGGMARNDIGEHIKLWGSATQYADDHGHVAYSEALHQHHATVSPRQLIGRLAAQRRMDYASLTVGGASWKDQPALQHDVNQQTYRDTLPRLIYDVYDKALVDKIYELDAIGVPSDEIRRRAIRYAQNYLRSAAFILGDVCNTRQMVEDHIATQAAYTL